MATINTLAEFRKWFRHKLTEEDQLLLDEQESDSLSQMQGERTHEELVRRGSIKEGNGWSD